MLQNEPLIPGNYYHIFNRGINSSKLFNETSNYEHFLELYGKYISPVANTFAWVLMPNHFHFLVQIKENVVYKYSNSGMSVEAVKFFENHKWETIDLADLSACTAPDSVKTKGNELNIKIAADSVTTNKANASNIENVPDSVKTTENTETIKIPKPHLHFSHLFNAYSSYFNKHYNRHGSLFERPFHRKSIGNETYLKHVIIYIHNNPVHHGFCEHPVEYPWSSYLSFISEEPTMIKIEQAVNWFANRENFSQAHDSALESKWVEDFFGNLI